jgi:hypothetical protein
MKHGRAQMTQGNCDWVVVQQQFWFATQTLAALCFLKKGQLTVIE